jgi:nucleoside-diphosphate-sugar epimerase
LKIISPDALEGSNFIISGTNGFLARALKQKLENMSKVVHSLNRTEIQGANTFTSHRYLEGGFKFESFGEVDYVFHLAAVYRREKSRLNFNDMLDSNLKLTAQILFDASQFEIPVITTGSYTQDFNGNRGEAMTEYAALKNITEELAQYFVNRKNFSFTTIRLYETFGPDDTRPKILYRIIDSLIQRKPISLPKSDLEFNFLHLSDFVNGILSVAAKNQKSPGFHKLSLRNLQNIKLSELITILEKMTGEKLQVSFENSFDLHPNVEKLWFLDSVPEYWVPEKKFLSELNSLVINREEMLRKGQKEDGAFIG